MNEWFNMIGLTNKEINKNSFNLSRLSKIEAEKIKVIYTCLYFI